MSRLIQWLLRQWHGTPIPRDPVPPQPCADEGFETLASLIDSDTPANFDEIARRLQR
ncbi:hypothetical protein GGQ85_000737 [Nitrobacter vulgaris]|nr:hypothetical protein [Nitrobacter vulgaris]